MAKTNGRAGRIEKEMRSILSLFVINQMKSYLDCMLSVSAVKVASDLRSAKVYVSAFGDQVVEKDILQALEDFRVDMQEQIGQGLRTKYVPKLQFFIDDTYEENFKVMGKLRELGYETKASDFTN